MSNYTKLMNNLEELKLERIKENKKEIEIVSGDGSNLDISPVYEDVNTLRPKSNDKKPKDIVIPEPKKK